MHASVSAKPRFGIVRAVDVIERLCFRLSCIAVFFMMLLVTVDAIARYALDSPIVGVYEITEDYLMVILVFLGLSHAFRKGAFVRVTSFVRFVPARARTAFEKLCAAASIAVFALIAAGGFTTGLHAARIGEFSSNILHYPLAPAYFLVTVGSVMLCARLIQSLMGSLPDAEQDAAHAPSFD